MTRTRVQLHSLEDRVTPSVSLVADINRDLVMPLLVAVNNTVLFRTGPNHDEIWRSDGTPAGTGPAEPDVQLDSFGNGVEFAGAYYFLGHDRVHGDELWRTDGTAQGTQLVCDTLAGPSSGYPHFLTVAGNTLYFVANGNQLWRSDGTTPGTVSIQRIGINSPATDGVEELAAAGNRVYMRVDGVHGGELWTSDGTQAGTHLVADLFAAGDYDVWRLLGAADGSFYFSASANGNPGLWVTDGTAAGTNLVRDDLTPTGPAAALGGKLYFVAGIYDKELWATDGTAAGTILVKDIANNAYSLAKELVVQGSYLYFMADDGSTGRELWRSDGTADGTIRLADLYPGPASSDPSFLTPAADGLYFTAIAPMSGQELWKTDGSPEGTVQVADLEPGPGSSFPTSLVSTGDRVFWVGNTTADGSALWVAGAGTGPTSLSPVPAATSSLYSGLNGASVTIGGVHYFRNSDGVSGEEIWRTDGTATGTWLLKDIVPGPDSSYPSSLTAVDGTLYFATVSPDAGVELWASDGTTDGTRTVKAIEPGVSRFGPLNLTAIQGKLVFTATTTGQGTELWVTDGTTDGTRFLKDIYPGTGSAFNTYRDPKFTELNGYLYFEALDADHGLEIWRTDGTENGTTLVTDLPAPWIGLPDYPTVVFWSPERVGNRIAFWGRSGTSVALWATDGTASGTVLIRQLLPVYRFVYGGGLDIPGYYISVLDDRAVLGDRMLFWARDAAHPVALWATDGTQEGTIRVRSIRPRGELVEASGLAYFVNSNGRELWRTDGSAAGTVRLRTFTQPVRSLVDFDGHLYFIGHDPAHGYGLWTSDGTVRGTRRVKDLVAGPIPEYERPSMYQRGGALFINVNSVNDTGPSAEETTLWRSDGTEAGTHPIALGNYSFVAELNGVPIFKHYDVLTGEEFWRYDPTTTGADHYNLEDGLRLDVPAAAGLLANDADGGGQPLTATLVTKPKNGRLTLRPDGSFFYQPFSPDISGTDTFVYRAEAAGEQSPPVTVTIDVDLVNQAPVAGNDSAAGRAGNPLTVRVLANDKDPDNDTLTVSSFTQGTSGRVSQVGGALIYTPRVAGAVTDTFTYTVRDPRGETATATVTVNLTVASPPRVTAVRLFPGPGTGSINLRTPSSRALPFQQFSRIEVTFSTDVSVAADDLRVIGADGSYALSGFSYDSARRTASWTIDGPAVATWADRLTVQIDGSAATGVTGPGGVAIGDWAKTVGLLVGDFNGDGVVTAADRIAVRNRFGPVIGRSRLFADIDGNGVVDAADVELVTANLGGRRV